jgi:hypothetical protein
VVVDVMGDGGGRGLEFGWCLGLVGGDEGNQEPVVDLEVEDGDADAVCGEYTAVGVWEAMDEALEPESAPLYAARTD